MKNIFKLSILALATFSLHGADASLQAIVTQVLQKPAIRAELTHGHREGYIYHLNFLARTGVDRLDVFTRRRMVHKNPAFAQLFDLVHAHQYKMAREAARKKFPDIDPDVALLRMPKIKRTQNEAVRTAARELLRHITPSPAGKAKIH